MCITYVDFSFIDTGILINTNKERKKDYEPTSTRTEEAVSC